jgi:hypothetical protein
VVVEQLRHGGGYATSIAYIAVYGGVKHQTVIGIVLVPRGGEQGSYGAPDERGLAWLRASGSCDTVAVYRTGGEGGDLLCVVIEPGTEVIRETVCHERAAVSIAQNGWYTVVGTDNDKAVGTAYVEYVIGRLFCG